MLKKRPAAMNGSLQVFLLAAMCVLFQPLVSAQTYSTPLPTVNDKDVALLRKNLQAEAKQLITKNMQFTDSEAAAFWPLYDQYAAEVRKVNDVRFGMIKEYAKIYKTMTPIRQTASHDCWPSLTRPSLVFACSIFLSSSKRCPERKPPCSCSWTGDWIASSTCRSLLNCPQSSRRETLIKACFEVGSFRPSVKHKQNRPALQFAEKLD